ncbi:hypothetical protein TSUD_26600 [Trifolium subterraneum]|uniref:Reverse transcriptase zinc-binding domain-containing protein n=1 Tax=Trifolium subterraneum TaxID=3900 RepID=A0A2Z6NVF5_TRISU|nr:hypothetical protein TSUD_26600 [Trifolium subterraneum]
MWSPKPTNPTCEKVKDLMINNSNNWNATWLTSWYKAIIEWKTNADVSLASTSNNQKEFWSKLWNLNVPPKHCHLMWCIINNAIPVKGNIFKKGITCDPLCPRCSTTMETCYHAFLDCEWAKQV